MILKNEKGVNLQFYKHLIKFYIIFYSFYDKTRKKFLALLFNFVYKIKS